MERNNMFLRSLPHFSAGWHQSRGFLFFPYSRRPERISQLHFNTNLRSCTSKRKDGPQQEVQEGFRQRESTPSKALIDPIALKVQYQIANPTILDQLQARPGDEVR
jgi:hypothetical protein